MAIRDDKEMLHQFISELFEWLEWCHQSRGGESPAGWPILHPLNHLQGYAAEAWSQFSTMQPQEMFHGQLEEVSERAMISAGLLGAQLLYKLQLLRDRALAALTGGSRARERFAGLLETLLDSLLDLLGAPGTAIKELVGLLKAQIR